MLDSWLPFGWRELILNDFAPALVLGAAWLLASLYRRTTRRPARWERWGIVVSIPILAWAFLACLQAAAATQIDMVSGYSRYPRFWACVASASVSGVVVLIMCVASAWLLSPGGASRQVPPGMIVCIVTAWVLVLATWATAFAREASHVAVRGGAAEQGDEADEAGASDGASQLIPGVRQTS